MRELRPYYWKCRCSAHGKSADGLASTEAIYADLITRVRSHRDRGCRRKVVVYGEILRVQGIEALPIERIPGWVSA